MNIVNELDKIERDLINKINQLKSLASEDDYKRGYSKGFLEGINSNPEYNKTALEIAEDEYKDALKETSNRLTQISSSFDYMKKIVSEVVEILADEKQDDISKDNAVKKLKSLTNYDSIRSVGCSKVDVINYSDHGLRTFQTKKFNKNEIIDQYKEICNKVDEIGEKYNLSRKIEQSTYDYKSKVFVCNGIEFQPNKDDIIKMIEYFNCSFHKDEKYNEIIKSLSDYLTYALDVEIEVEHEKQPEKETFKEYIKKIDINDNKQIWSALAGTFNQEEIPVNDIETVDMDYFHYKLCEIKTIEDANELLNQIKDKCLTYSNKPVNPNIYSKDEVCNETWDCNI